MRFFSLLFVSTLVLASCQTAVPDKTPPSGSNVAPTTSNARNATQSNRLCNDRYAISILNTDPSFQPQRVTGQTEAENIRTHRANAQIFTNRIDFLKRVQESCQHRRFGDWINANQSGLEATNGQLRAINAKNTPIRPRQSVDIGKLLSGLGQAAVILNGGSGISSPQNNSSSGRAQCREIDQTCQQGDTQCIALPRC